MSLLLQVWDFEPVKGQQLLLAAQTRKKALPPFARMTFSWLVMSARSRKIGGLVTFDFGRGLCVSLRVLRALLPGYGPVIVVIPSVSICDPAWTFCCSVLKIFVASSIESQRLHWLYALPVQYFRFVSAKHFCSDLICWTERATLLFSGLLTNVNAFLLRNNSSFRCCPFSK
jgi:hypothetical protein